MKKKGLLIYYTVSLLLLSGWAVSAGAQTVTTYIYANAPAGSYVTANSTATIRTDNNIVSQNNTQRGYAVFDLSSIPAGALIDSINIGYNIAGYAGPGTPSAWNTYGYAGSLVTDNTPATLFADMISGTSLSTQTYGAAVGNQVLISTAAATSFIQNNIGDSVSICFTSAGTKRYTFTGESGTAATTGIHSPYLAITYCPQTFPGTITGPASVCPGYSIALSDDTSGGTWLASNTNATVDDFGDVFGNTPGADTIYYIFTNSCGNTSAAAIVINVSVPPAFTITASADTICNGGSAQIIAATATDTILQQNFNTSLAPWTVDSTGSVGVFPSAEWNIDPDGYVNEALVTFHSPDNTSFAMTNSDTSGSGTVTLSSLISPSFSTVGYDSAALTFQQYYFNYPTDISAEADISTDGGITWTTLANYADSISNDSIGSGAAFATESISLSAYVGNPNVMIRFYYNSPWGYWWAIDNVAITGSGAATWTSAVANLYDDAAFTTPYTAGTTLDTVYALPSTVSSTTSFTYYATESTASCASTDSITITVQVPASPVQGSNVVCTGAEDFLTDATGGGTWSATNGTATVDPSLGIVTGVSAGTDTIIYAVSGVCGLALDTFIINVSQSPVAGTISGSGYICTGTTVTFTDTASGGFWVLNNTSVATIDGTGDVTGVSAGTDSVYYIVENSCGLAYAAYPISVATVFVPALRIAANPGDTSCIGLPVTYYAVPVNGGNSPSYAWSVNGITVASADSFTYTPNNGDVISCTLTSDAPCLLAPGTATASVTAVVNNATPPAITIGDGAYTDSVCIFTSVVYTAAVTNGGTSPSYIWSVNGVASAAGSSFTYAPNNGDIITCQVTSSNACAIPDTVTSNSLVMSVFINEYPVVSITANPGDSVCTGTTVTLSASSVFGGLTPFYRWTLNGVNVATGVDYTFTPATGDSVYCMLASSSSCTALDSVFSDTIGITTVSPVIPEVTITSFGGTLIAPGTPDTLVAVIADPVFPVTYQWEVNGIAIPGATSAIFVVADSTDTTATIACEVTNSDPCHTAGRSNSLVITVGNVGVKQLSLTGSDIQLLPNPNNGSFLVQGTLPADTKEVTLEVSDIVGHIVYQETVPVQNGLIKSAITLDGRASSGMYLMHIIGENANEVIRFTLNR